MFTSIRTTELVIFSALSIALLQSSSLSISALENDLVAGVNRIGKDGQSFWERLFKGWNDVDGVESADDITSINAEDDQLNGDWLIEQQIPGEESMKVGALLVQRRRLAAVTKEDTFNNYQTSRQQHQERNERALSNQNNLKTHSESFLAKVIGDNEDYIMQRK